MKVAILVKFITDYVRDEYEDIIYFPSVIAAMTYLLDRNCPVKDLTQYEFEEIEE
jgi:hypothetical protein